MREMPVLAAARIMEITDQRLWRIVMHYVGQAVARLDLTRVTAIGLDETAAKRGHTYVTVFIDLDRTDKPVVFVTPGRGKDTVAKFKAFLATHGGSPGRVVEVVCDMSGAFIAAIGESFDNAAITVDWFHVVQLFTKALDEVRRAEARHSKLPKALRWAILKRADGRLTEAQTAALAELEASDLFTAIAWRIKEKLRWVRQAQSVQAARWRITNFLRHASEILDPDRILDPIRKALATVETHSKRILQRWTSSHSNARLEGLNGLFQAARARARGYRNVTTFATMIYMIAAPWETCSNHLKRRRTLFLGSPRTGGGRSHPAAGRGFDPWKNALQRRGCAAAVRQAISPVCCWLLGRSACAAARKRDNPASRAVSSVGRASRLHSGLGR